MSPLLHSNCPIIVSQRRARLDSPRAAVKKAANPPEEALARRRRRRLESGSRTSARSYEKPKLSRTKRQSGGGEGEWGFWGGGGEVDKTTERSGSFGV